MVKEGEVSYKWSDENEFPIIIGPDKQIDYIYFII
jgi:hypothetical protein